MMIENLILDDGFGLKGEYYIIQYENLDNDEGRILFLNNLKAKDERAFYVWFESLKKEDVIIPNDFID